ncbi:hypothetical protein [Morganella psychrotolerans]|uniref:hypothetical protein n=1 Tax=Morganella psychrotolerans TaxID=368603 RepID=UPI0039AEBB19
MHFSRVLNALDMEIELIDSYQHYLDSDNNVTYLNDIKNDINNLSTTVHGYTDMMNTSELIDKAEKHGHNLSELVNSYYDHVEQLKKIKFPNLPVKFDFPQKDTLILSIDDLIKKLCEEIKYLKLQIEDTVKFSALLQKINWLTDMSLAVIRFWVMNVSRYDAYFAEGASVEGLNDIVSGHINALKYYKS